MRQFSGGEEPIHTSRDERQPYNALAARFVCSVPSNKNVTFSRNSPRSRGKKVQRDSDTHVYTCVYTRACARRTISFEENHFTPRVNGSLIRRLRGGHAPTCLARIFAKRYPRIGDAVAEQTRLILHRAARKRDICTIWRNVGKMYCLLAHSNTFCIL